MECVILIRYNSGRIDYIAEDKASDCPEIAVFQNPNAAVEYAHKSRLLQTIPYQIVELDLPK